MSSSPTNIEVSVVIPAYNQADLLIRLLDSLAAMTDTPVWEVIIVDDASTDNTRRAVEAWLQAQQDIRGCYLCQQHNQGPGAARNRGLEAAQGNVVAFTDTDCAVSPDWLTALVAPLADDEQIAGVGGTVLPCNPDNPFARYNTLNHTLEPITSPDYAIPYLVTCNGCYRRDALLSVGGFPTDIQRPGGEDIAASIALYKQGYRFAFAPDATIQHDYRDTWRSFARTWMNYGYGCGLIAH
ncbi:MAG: glycosyltransferase family 2 protein, partial [Candidatus Hydrogenedentes bacterium]|nr:glycosyltransferase family 2 protein [Candidatus Hydrogenedentota bacterium]